MPNDKLSSIKWAIEELSKQKQELESRLVIAHKRDETSDLITEVQAQREALEKRISALEDGLKTSVELVQTPAAELENEILEIDQKLEIAGERLENLEQEKYFQELGRNLTGKHETPSEENDFSVPEMHENSLSGATHPLPLNKASSQDSPKTFPNDLKEAPSSTQTTTMKSTNRMQESEVSPVEESSSRLQESSQTADTSTEAPLPQTSLELDTTAKSLGVEPEFLAEKGIQAILRMIHRNGEKLTFPLEVEQID